VDRRIRHEFEEQKRQQTFGSCCAKLALTYYGFLLISGAKNILILSRVFERTKTRQFWIWLEEVENKILRFDEVKTHHNKRCKLIRKMRLVRGRLYRIIIRSSCMRIYRGFLEKMPGKEKLH
jgi:hypothetical protein